MRAFLLVSALLVGCGSSGGGGGDRPSGSVSVSGNIRTTAARVAIDAKSYATAAAPDVGTGYSTLGVVDVSGRFGSVSPGDMVFVDTTVTNNSAETVDGVAIAFIEDARFATKERWSCLKCYPDGGSGSSCNTLWEVDGGTIIEPMDPSPALGVCDASVPEVSGTCVTVFPDTVDCTSPTWRIDYDQPGDGLWRAEGSISIPPGDTLSSSVGYGDSGIDVRPSHYARWEVWSSGGTLLARKDYVFDVAP